MLTTLVAFFPMARKLITGIDIGTYQVKVLIAEHIAGKDKHFPRIIGTGVAESKGLRHGYIVNTSDIIRSISVALQHAEKEAKVKAKTAYISIGGVGLDEVHSRGDVVIARADGTITDIDIEKAHDESEERAKAHMTNRKILHSIPLAYHLDDQKIPGRPLGLQGNRLGVDMFFITSFEQHLDDLITAVEETGLDVIDVMASPLAASLVTLTKAQKKVGCVLANIGSETVSIVVFEDGLPVSLKVFPMGSTDITNDIALGLKISIEEAEQIKRGAITGTSIPKRKLDDIVAARLSDIFDLIENHLKTSGKQLLPAGIIITGGGSGITSIEDIARASLRLPSKVARPQLPYTRQIKDGSWAVAYGLTIWGLTADDEPLGLAIAKKTSSRVVNFFKQFLP